MVSVLSVLMGVPVSFVLARPQVNWWLNTA